MRTPLCSNIQKIHHFLSFTSFNYTFDFNFAALIIPLTKFTKDIPLKWDSDPEIGRQADVKAYILCCTCSGKLLVNKPASLLLSLPSTQGAGDKVSLDYISDLHIPSTCLVSWLRHKARNCKMGFSNPGSCMILDLFLRLRKKAMANYF